MNGRVRRILFFTSLCLTAVPAGAAPARAGGGCHPGAVPDAGRAVRGTEVQMAMMCFEPRVLAVQPGTSVRFTNDDRMGHVVIGTGWGAADELALGESMDHRFSEPGIHPYSCYLHPGMNGAIVVGDIASASAPTSAEPQESAPATSAELASSASSGGGSAGPFLAAGGIAGGIVGSLATRRRRKPSR